MSGRAYVVLTAGHATRLEDVETRSKIMTQLELGPVIRDHAIVAHATWCDVVVVVATQANECDEWFKAVCSLAFESRVVVVTSPEGVGNAISCGLHTARAECCDEVILAHADTVVSPQDAAKLAAARGIGVGTGIIHPVTVYNEERAVWEDGVVAGVDGEVYIGLMWMSIEYGVPSRIDGAASLLNIVAGERVLMPSWRDVGDVNALRAPYTMVGRDSTEVKFVGDRVYKSGAGSLSRLPVDMRPAVIDDDCIERLSLRTVADLWLLEPRFNLRRATEDILAALRRLHAQPVPLLPMPSHRDISHMQYSRIRDRAEMVRTRERDRFHNNLVRAVYLDMVDEVADLGEYMPVMPLCNTHGDPNLGNVFYDTRVGSVKFIDAHDITRAIGDPEYDIAKVYCSAWLDFCAISLGMRWRRSSANDVRIIEDVIVSAGYDLDRVKRLAILLLLAGIPLHQPGESDALALRVHERWREMV